MFPHRRVTIPIPVASWISLGRMRAVAALAAVALTLLAGCNPDSCDDENDCGPLPDAAAKDAAIPDTTRVDQTAAPIDMPPDSAPDTLMIPLPAPPATCEASPAPRLPQEPVHIFTVKPTIGGQAVELGVPITVGGSKVTLSQMRFFVTMPVLGRPAETAVYAELVDAAGKPLPYGLALVDLEKPESLTLRLRAPASDYNLLSLSIGVHPACNAGPLPAALVYPLNANGGMTWTWTLGYIFLFLEGNKNVGTPAPFAAHGGVFPPNSGAIPLATYFDRGTTGPRVLEARLDKLIEAAEGQSHIGGGTKVMERLPTSDLWKVTVP
jgi:hypothetical protein